MDRRDIRNEYGEYLGQVKRNGKDIEIRDRYGAYAGKVKKRILSDDHDVYDKYGDRKGSAEKEFMGNRVIFKDSDGRNTGGHVDMDLDGCGAVGGIVLLVAGIMLFSSFDFVGEHLEAAMMPGSAEFIVITLPNLLLMAYSTICIIRGRGGLMTGGGFFSHLFRQIQTGILIYICTWLVMGAVETVKGESFLEVLLIVPMGALMFIAAFFVVLLIASVIGAVFTRAAEKNC